MKQLIGLFFALVFLLLAVLQINNNDLFHLVTLVLLLWDMLIVVRIWQVKTVYSKVILYGTLCAVIGVCGMHLLMGIDINAPKPTVYLPLQIGELFDVLILGYGLSLKAAESDKKLMKYLQENQKLLEVERSRLAKDLHDGLGGILSGVKLNLSSIKGNMILQDTDTMLFAKSIDQLDKAITEMRRVAHNMMPEALLKFGLGEAIQDYCDSLNESNTLKIKYTQMGNRAPLEKTIEVTLYRIVQELSNNVIKHAAATSLFIQLTQHKRGLTLTVEDDGKGFNTSQLSNYKGAGLRNVKSRVDYLKGVLQIEAQFGIGTSVNIDIPS
jgi:signal transduction histidine kinase